jgi:hypothetical protein
MLSHLNNTFRYVTSSTHKIPHNLSTIKKPYCNTIFNFNNVHKFSTKTRINIACRYTILNNNSLVKKPLFNCNNVRKFSTKTKINKNDITKKDLEETTKFYKKISEIHNSQICELQNKIGKIENYFNKLFESMAYIIPSVIVSILFHFIIVPYFLR